ncbi:MAG: response regulator PleD [Methanoregula sp. PtaU1.Bin051]|nr:MAG: response regulator PleD [Methanoregula sp. PtaU1.Bin051]
MMGGALKNGIKVLIAEDSRTQAEYLRHILENEGGRVVLAADGNEAWEQIRIDRPAIVLTDIVMPEMDGYELCRRIKGDSSTAQIPVVLVTQLFDPVDIIRGLEAGADNFIIKPFEPRHVISRIASVMEGLTRPDPDGVQKDLAITLYGNTHTITASRLRILTILLSTYDLAVSKNAELQEAHERLAALNEELQKTVQKVKEANDDLLAENTERKRVEDALANANKKLQLMASITRHDLLNQLTALHEYIELAQAVKEKDPARAWEHIGNAELIVNQTINTVQFTEDYQKIGIRSATWHDVRTLVNTTSRQLSLGPIKLENTIPEKTQVYADPLIEKVFYNLIDNAIRYGQKITHIRFSCRIAGNFPTIVCEDDGVGINADEKERIFSYEYGMNTGLGLFLSREILANTGIKIFETGEPGEGARFEIRCPEGTLRRS